MTSLKTDSEQSLTQHSLQVHAAVRLRPPTVEGEPWQVQHLTKHSQYSVSPAVAWTIISFMGGAAVSDVIAQAADYGYPQSEITETISVLRQDQVLVDEAEGVLTDETQGTHMWAMQLMRQWSRVGWGGAVDYQISTCGYPAVSYSEGAAADAAIMREYLAVEDDTNRTKKYPVAAQDSLPCGSAAEALSSLTRPFDEVWEECCGRPRLLTAPAVRGEDIRTLCAAVFGYLRTRNIGPRDKRKPLFHKINPSGGGRHPTEGYVVSINVEDLRRGIYHFAVESSTLDFIAEAPDDQQLERTFDGLYRSRHERSFEPRALVILTSVFERNMFRYREPRTFRTVFMDAGCVITSLELLARSMGYSMYTHNAMPDTETEKLFGVQGMAEGLMYGAAIGVYEQ